MKQRILFVDDEPKVLTGIRRLMHGHRSEWGMQFCDDPFAALALIGESEFDVIVSDMRMPGMDGAELLSRVRELRPETVRIVLSGQSEQEKVMRAVGPAHQYLSKPCDPDTLQNTLRRAGEISEQLRDPALRRLVAGLSSLPTLPTVYHELVNELQGDDATIDRIAALIARDIGMTAKVLQLVNSSFFGLPVKIRDPEHAAALLGVDTLRPLVLTAGVFGQLEGSSAPAKLIEDVLQHSLTVGCLAKQICECERADEYVAANALLAGILHDVGKLIMADHFGARYLHVLQEATATKSELCELEAEEFGRSHAAVGGFLVGLWGLPCDLVEAVSLHHDDLDEAPQEIDARAAVLAANRLAKSSAGGEFAPFQRVQVACEQLPWHDVLAAAPA